MIVLGAGNRFRRDDALGLEVVSRLAGRVPPGVLLEAREGDLLGALDLWGGHDLAVLVDATSSGRSPGTVTRLLPRETPLPPSFSRSSTHGFGVAEAVALGQVLGSLPREVIVYGIEGRTFEAGVGLSPEAERAVDDVVRSVAREAAGRSGTSGRPAAARLTFLVRGAVQGVGFRPYVARLARELGLSGFVRNAPAGAEIEVEGPPPALAAFGDRLPIEAPPLAALTGVESFEAEPRGVTGFSIRESRQDGERSAVVLPDVATCRDCLREILDPADRRHRYPFTNCTNCGPRYSILLSLPYDRSRTTMKDFPLCDRCRSEYEDQEDRRYHAQPTACPECGPRLSLWDVGGRVLAARDDALRGAERAIEAGEIVAVKSLGGFHLVVDARNERAVRRLRERKGREEKPFAVLCPSIEAARRLARLSPAEERLLLSHAAPIVLVRRRGEALAPAVAPGNPNLGLLLPSNPLQHLLLHDLDFPVVATSGNLSEEPLCADENEALDRLGGVADRFLVHDRPIARSLDDSIARVVLSRVMVLRRGRGYAPLTLTLPAGPESGARPAGAGRPGSPGHPRSVLAVGAHEKGTVALARGRDVVIGEYLGDLGSARTDDRFRRSVEDLQSLHGVRAALAVSDLHPDYPTTRFAERGWPGARRVQHHHAHVLACLAENELAPPALGVAWDGTGWGEDGTVWGGEFLRVRNGGFDRVAHLRHFRLPGAGAAVREGRRAALGLLFEIFGGDVPGDIPSLAAFAPGEAPLLLALLAKGVQSPVTSSAGRLFDAFASLLDLRHRSSFEGQAAMDLEFAAEGETGGVYDGAGTDWEPLVRSVLVDRARGVSTARIAARIHDTLAEAIVGAARVAGEERVALSGGCFQNRRLLERTVRRLLAEGFRPVWPQRVPPNDQGVALGQLAALEGEG